MIDAGRFDEAQTLAHSIKGVAGNLGLSGLHAAAQSLERALKARAGIVAALSAFREAAATLPALRESVAGSAETDSGHSPGSKHAPADRLARLLATGDATAVPYFFEHSATLRTVLGHQVHAEIDTALTDLDFARALRLLAHPAQQEVVR